MADLGSVGYSYDEAPYGAVAVRNPTNNTNSIVHAYSGAAIRGLFVQGTILGPDASPRRATVVFCRYADIVPLCGSSNDPTTGHYEAYLPITEAPGSIYDIVVRDREEVYNDLIMSRVVPV